MNKENFDKIDKMFNDNKTSKFIEHLIYSYIPVSKSEILKESQDKRMLCSLTGKKLILKSELISIISSSSDKEELIKSLQIKLDSNGNIEPKFPEFIKKINEEKIEKINGRSIAYTGKDTTSMLSLEAIKSLIEWYQTQIVKSNKKIIHISNKLNPKKKIKVAESKNKKSVTSLGDFSVLKDLKSKMETWK